MSAAPSRRAMLAAPLVLLTSRANASPWPTRPLRMLSPLPAGSVPDATMRLFADGLARELGQPVVVENRPGGEGVVATTAFLSLRDDHKLFFSFAGPVTVNPLTIAPLPYDPAQLVPVAAAAIDHVAVSAAPDLPVRDLPGLVALARARPGGLAYVMAPGAIGLAFEGFLAAERLDLLRIAYRSAADALNDLAAGRVQVTVAPLATLLPQARADRARLLAVTGPARAPAAPDIPTTAEQGFPHYVFQGFVGLFAAADMLPEQRRRLGEAMRRVAAEAETQRRLTLAGQDSAPGGAEEFARMIAEQRAQVIAGLAARGLPRP